MSPKKFEKKFLCRSFKKGGYSAGEGYLIEAKLWHIEVSNSWTEQLDRAFKQCKRALATKDMVLDHINKRATLDIKVSKMDRGAKGVKRTMQCLCANNTCLPECPFSVSADLLGKVEKFNGTSSGLTLLKDKSPPTKSQIVKTWQLLFGAEATLGGSSTVAHLGRRKSNAILSYERKRERRWLRRSAWTYRRAGEMEVQFAAGDLRVQESVDREWRGQVGRGRSLGQTVLGKPHLPASESAEPPFKSHPLEPGQSSGFTTGILAGGLSTAATLSLWTQMPRSPARSCFARSRKEVGTSKAGGGGWTSADSWSPAATCSIGWHDKGRWHQRKIMHDWGWAVASTGVVQENETEFSGRHGLLFGGGSTSILDRFLSPGGWTSADSWSPAAICCIGWHDKGPWHQRKTMRYWWWAVASTGVNI